MWIALIGIVGNGSAQRVVNVEFPQSGQIILSDDVTVPKINNGYTLWLPESTKPKGLVVFFHARRDTVSEDFIISYALKNNLGVAYITTSNRFDFLFHKERLDELDGYLKEIIREYDVPPTNILYCGMSLAGTRALRMAIYQTDFSGTNPAPCAIAICDAPLDMMRFYTELKKAKERDVHPAAANEGAWVSAYLKRYLKGEPNEAVENYTYYSPYTYTDDGGPHLDKLKDIAIRAYTEPDVEWWMTTRGKDYYGMNAIDMAALIKDLRFKGNERAELMLTKDKGIKPNGERHPHSWSIVDERDLIDWFLTIVC